MFNVPLILGLRMDSENCYCISIKASIYSHTVFIPIFDITTKLVITTISNEQILSQI